MSKHLPQLSFTTRILTLVVLFAAEALAATLFLDGATPVPHGAWLAAFIHRVGPAAAKFAIAFSTLFATFAFLRYREQLKQAAADIAGERINRGFAATHFAAMGVFAVSSFGVYYGKDLTALQANLASAIWILAVAAAIGCAAPAVLPVQFWRGILRITGALWGYAAAGAALTVAATGTVRPLWTSASRVTFHMVEWLLSPFVHDMVIQPEHLRIGTHRFTVVIADACSGLEGIALLLLFACLWLFLFRKEVRFPHALILLPLGVIVLFVCNALRITALVLIGNAGAQDIAAGGFHSQAGWIAFNSVAFGAAIAARQWKWVSADAHGIASAADAEESANPTAAYLVPFLAILAAGMIAHAASARFEWLYPIRILAAAIALWIYRRSYSDLDWRCTLLAPAAGVAVFLIWILLDRMTGGTAPMPAMLSGAPAGIRNTWIALRLLGSVFTVPIAEELAFRGFALRRLVRPDFESISFRSTGWGAIAISSLLFGLMHGGRWLPATIAGALYAMLVRRSDRIGDAVVAHATSNALLSLLVLQWDQWQLW